tara:strand:+ start:1120 stop:1419 length:300 start_codon:yes stop_codon:yes gene_type:complete
MARICEFKPEYFKKSHSYAAPCLTFLGQMSLRVQIYQLLWMPRIADHLSGTRRFLADTVFARKIVGFCPTAGPLLMIADKANEAEANHKNDTCFAYAHG